MLTGTVSATINGSVLIATDGGDEMDTFTLSLLRCFVLRALGRNPLVRMGDRVEAVVLALVIVTAMVVLPIAGAIGTAVHEDRARVYADEALTRHIVAATAVEDSTLVGPRYAQTFLVDVRWRTDGVEHVGSRDLSHEAKAGDPLGVWVDDRGDQVAAPTPTWYAGLDAAFAGAGTWLIAVTGAAGVLAFVRLHLMRRRYSGWDREWQALVSDHGGRTGSQS